MTELKTFPVPYQDHMELIERDKAESWLKVLTGVMASSQSDLIKE